VAVAGTNLRECPALAEHSWGKSGAAEITREGVRSGRRVITALAFAHEIVIDPAAALDRRPATE